MKRILLADDHNIVLDGLKALLSTVPEWRIEGCCVNGAEVLDSVASQPPDLLIMDVRMPVVDGIEVLRRLRQRDQLPTTIVLAASLSNAQIREAVELGAWGIVMKEEASEMIVECAQAALDGEPWMPAAPLRRVLGRGEESQPSPTSNGALTEREREIARCVGKGLSNKAIAHQLKISEGTVKTHLHRVYKKVGVGNRVQLALQIREIGGV